MDVGCTTVEKEYGKHVAMYSAKLCMARISSPSSYLVDLMDLVDLNQVVSVSCPRVEKDYGKLVTNHTANKAPTQLCHFVANTMGILTLCTWFTIKACERNGQNAMFRFGPMQLGRV